MNLLRLLVILANACLLGACAGLPKTDGRPASHAVRETAATDLGRTVSRFVAAHPEASGFHPLAEGAEALAARLGLAGMARRSLDLQYYIWNNDGSGKQLVAALFAAADRGVRVRVLLDDFGSSAKDENLLALDSHPQIEVRLFNPITNRTARLFGTVFDFCRVNRRMHNKAFIADNQVAIVGGRNIGDEYFGAHREVNFSDFDVAAVGPVVRDVSQSFDGYWNCRSAIGIIALTRERATPEPRADLGTLGAGESEFARELRRGNVNFMPGRAWVVADGPEKVTTAEDDTSSHLAPKLLALVGTTRRELLVVSPYFIPGKDGVDRLTELRRRGVRVVVLTNALAATDVAAVHAGYQHYRKELLRAGVELYENKPTGDWGPRPGRLRRLLKGGLSGSSRASLHAKTFTFDDRLIFVGSMNLDPRSIRLNTEIGILVDCPELAALFNRLILRDLDGNAYRLELVGDRIEWVTTENGKSVRFTTEPQTRGWQRFVVGVISLLPLEGQL